MKTVSIIFRRSNLIGSRILKTVLWSEWSHCGIIDGDTVIEAAAFHGVVRTSLEQFKADGTHYTIIDIHLDDETAEKVLENARSQLGKKYDYLGLLGIAFRNRHAEERNAWFCSELVAWAFEQAGHPLVRKAVWRVTPQDIYIPFYT
jgi:uncharacterized protein YycO